MESREEASRLVERWGQLNRDEPRRPGVWAVERKADGVVAGTVICSCRSAAATASSRSAGISIPDSWGQGLATESARGALEWAARDVGADRGLRGRARRATTPRWRSAAGSAWCTSARPRSTTTPSSSFPCLAPSPVDLLICRTELISPGFTDSVGRIAVPLSAVALTIGIVGLPNAGKSTLFNALTKNDVLAANYPFATIEPNVGVVGVPDPRLAVLAEMFDSAKSIPATVQFVDIAGIVRGASEGEGLGNKFLSHIREAAAICQVTRVFRDDDVTHVDGKVSPADDISTIQTELILADLQTVENALPRLEKEARLKKERRRVLEAVREAKDALEAGTPILATAIDKSAAARAHADDGQAVPLRLQLRCRRARRRRAQEADARPRGAGRGDLPRREVRGRAGRARR